ncbi:methionine synthase (B12-independent) [Salsuginibacillus halophilus]|uniref:5-methyltetrahydropteroyltriglutamate--homocysteine S-methyltransferase n=1 Tax=Salsuginibacillus halophilus TaxID=517424 RepID=A0A2P8HAJ7_9BACI|nr:5-methyltetrahydropteroyltriglutamate--homocysteine S-methyltransferase [Salsuginibacillus halophilus]PSL43255.1 methionine synthase (B12-independent) [Salsuginibacillus halophilus]
MNKATTIGYLQLDGKRAWKRALESFWQEKTSEEALHQTLKTLRLHRLHKQESYGIDHVPVNDFTYYDRMLDTAWMFNLIPARHRTNDTPDVTEYFAMARGTVDAGACAMKKWFNTNYHYIVPEYENQPLKLVRNLPLEAYAEAEAAGITDAKPVLIGPYTFVKLSSGFNSLGEGLEAVLPLYTQVLAELNARGVNWVQLEEPYAVTDEAEADAESLAHVYETLSEVAPNIMLQTYFEAPAVYETLTQLPVAGLGLDVTKPRTQKLLKTQGFPADKVLAAGVIPGDRIWKQAPAQVETLLRFVEETAHPKALWVQPTTSLLHVPETKTHETRLSQTLYDQLAFADEKLAEVKTAASRTAPAETTHPAPVNEHAAVFAGVDTHRGTNADKRRVAQQSFQLPLLPTTTIGSLPQTTDVRKLRRDYKQGELSAAAYEEALEARTAGWIETQEALGLDVLVHGEFERNDMVEYFGERLEGYAFTDFGWVQSYGSRGVKPPIVHDTVHRPEAMTVKAAVHAQSLTEKPLKGMLTGPVTMVNWSFLPEDQPKSVTAAEVAEALAEEVRDLEAAGITMIQIDEPAFKEGYPLRAADQAAYEDWAVRTFQRTHRDVADSTQVHTHMCYSQFEEILEAVGAMDADVISIEASRSRGKILEAFADGQFVNDIGLGVYDIHSPRTPAVAEMEAMIERCLDLFPAERFWVNPDCGLKTRSEAEAKASLEAMVEAARNVRERVEAKV